MNTEEMVKVIYKKIADKTLSFGCKIERQGNYYTVIEGRHFIYEKTGKYIKTTSQSIEELSCESIGHPVMIGDVLDYLENAESLKGFVNIGGLDEVYWEYDSVLFDKWKEKRKPIEKQSDETINYIFDLINK